MALGYFSCVAFLDFGVATLYRAQPRGINMPNLAAVLEARTVFNEALNWSVMKWLSEKKKVRKIADAANLTLDNAEKELRRRWDPSIEEAYKALQDRSSHLDSSGDAIRTARAIKQAHDKAIELRAEAEAMFSKAEERLSVATARDACHKALEGWRFHEEAVCLSEKAGLATAGKKR